MKRSIFLYLFELHLIMYIIKEPLLLVYKEKVTPLIGGNLLKDFAE